MYFAQPTASSNSGSSSMRRRERERTHKGHKPSAWVQAQVPSSDRRNPSTMVRAADIHERPPVTRRCNNPRDGATWSDDRRGRT